MERGKDRAERALRLMARARRRYLRRKARSEVIWTGHVAKTGHQPTLWHARYERSLMLEHEAYRLMANVWSIGHPDDPRILPVK